MTLAFFQELSTVVTKHSQAPDTLEVWLLHRVEGESLNFGVKGAYKIFKDALSCL